jgi:hypothetical protein
MSIKIDLLPGYINLQRWFKNWLLIASLALLLTGTTLYLLYHQGQETLRVTRENQESVETNAARAEKTEADKAAAETAAAPIETNVQFLVDAGKTGAERAALMDLVRRYVYAGAVVSSLDMSDGQNVTINATVRDPEEYLRFVYKLREGSATYNGPLFAANPRTQSVVPSGIPGGPNLLFSDPVSAPGEPARAYQYPLNITATGALRYPVTVPSEGGAAAGAAAGGATPGGAPPGAIPGGSSSSSSPSSSSPSSGSSGGSPPGATTSPSASPTPPSR